MELVRWGVLGCGDNAKTRFLPALAAADNGELYALTGDTPEKRKALAAFGPKKIYASYDELLEDPMVEAVYIALPNSMHCEWTVKALKKKKHVLCEKPLALDEAEVRLMQQTAAENGVQLMEAFAYLHGGVMAQVDTVLESGILGKVSHVSVRFNYRVENPGDIRFSPALGGGCLYDQGCYAVSFARWVLQDEPTEAFAFFDQAEGEVDKNAAILLRFSRGSTFTANISLERRTDCDRAIVGDKGELLIPIFFNFEGSKTLLLKKDRGVEKLPLECPNPYRLETEQFGRCIRLGESPLVSWEFSLGNARALDMIRAAALR